MWVWKYPEKIVIDWVENEKTYEVDSKILQVVSKRNCETKIGNSNEKVKDLYSRRMGEFT